MKKRLFILGAIFFLFGLPMSDAEEERLDELTGVIRTKNVKALSPFILEIDGGQSIGLRGDGVEEIPDGARIWVKGRLHTFLYDNRGDSLPAMNPLQWHIYMEVSEWEMISDPFERPKR